MTAEHSSEQARIPEQATLYSVSHYDLAREGELGEFVAKAVLLDYWGRPSNAFTYSGNGGLAGELTRAREQCEALEHGLGAVSEEYIDDTARVRGYAFTGLETAQDYDGQEHMGLVAGGDALADTDAQKIVAQLTHDLMGHYPWWDTEVTDSNHAITILLDGEHIPTEHAFPTIAEVREALERKYDLGFPPIGISEPAAPDIPR
ncbi:MAG TPA: hypothetical protein VHT70_01405 [Candidatus Saccharimonadales bacterium]|jgi:hypothetical protein|nr:hypothetical protein [Candidatus Saccharimonadales bacterium]